jgi:hypothetical protein
MARVLLGFAVVTASVVAGALAQRAGLVARLGRHTSVRTVHPHRAGGR